MRSIHPDSALASASHQRDRSEHRVSRLVPAGRFAVKPEIQVYNNKVNIVSWPDRLGLIIESQDIADALRSIFELSFESAEKAAKQR